MICFDDYDNPVITKCCNKVFCLLCISNCVINCRGKCPQCRQIVKLEELTVYNDMVKVKPEVIEEDGIFETKFDALKSILHGINKALFYIRTYNSEEEAEYLRKILILLKDSGFKIKIHKNIDKSKINNYIEKFRLNENKEIWIMESEKASAGLNFPFVDTIVTYDKYDSETQIMGRMLRVGVTDVKNFFRIKYQD